MKSDQVRTNWRDVLDHVRSGGTVIVEHYNRPIARIAPLEDTVTTQQDDGTRTEYALCWESAGTESAWVIRVLDNRPGAPENTWDLWLSHPDMIEGEVEYAKQWAAERLEAEEGRSVEGWKRDKDGDWIPLFAATVTATPEHFTAWVTTDTSALDQPNADVVVLADELRGEPDDPNAWSSTGSPLFSAATSVDAAEGDIEDALREAAELLAEGGWRLTGKWKSVPTGCTATVERA